nr:immunoglobulin light chain junction region [Macaca mulatta]MOX97908.1 immunoglobulin light chain junction region [Macaca mulatta]MOX99945.1 immunoglobulin light chain junction region [Macaca mulatta]MOY00323.1 immunoglobulin light chain junction region [Macaca mulatta]MOY00434.1 immunoglobulin light chain junction region [Macaca mulatta]
CMQALELPWTF